MAHLDFYARTFGATSQDAAFRHFVGHLQNYYDANFYVDWAKAIANAGRFEAELALLSTLCKKPDRLDAARALLRRYPQIIPALPILVACRGPVVLVEDLASARVASYDFEAPSAAKLDAAVEHYSLFLVASGILDLLEHITSVRDYVVGVEVGMDTNARKNRGGDCGVRALRPWVSQVLQAVPGVEGEAEVSSDRLRQMGCSLPSSANGLVWDFALWTRAPHRRRFIVLEVNHYGSSGSKPPAIAREYTARARDLQGGRRRLRLGDGWLGVAVHAEPPQGGVRCDGLAGQHQARVEGNARGRRANRAQDLTYSFVRATVIGRRGEDEAP